MPLRASTATLIFAWLAGSVFRNIPELALVSRTLTGALLKPRNPWGDAPVTISASVWLAADVEPGTASVVFASNDAVQVDICISEQYWNFFSRVPFTG